MSTPEPLERLLGYICAQRGLDFSGYDRSSLERRVARRMEEVGLSSHERYLDYLEVHPDEFAHLFDTILINVTGFFRDPDAWEHLASEILPRILEGKGDTDPIRVWCAGCASGEETYTMAMVLAEALGEEVFLERVEVYATDIDDEALDRARLATYGAKQVEDVRADLLERYFERRDTRYVLREDLRRAVIFGRNDLVGDTPISRIDLLACRNTLMYFNAETQQRILARFHSVLDPEGYLFVGRSEVLTGHANLFRPVTVRRRVFSKVARPMLRERLFGLPAADERGDGPTADGLAAILRDAALDCGRNAQLVVDRHGILLSSNQQARQMFGLEANDAGRALRDLKLSYRPVELHSQLDDVWQTGRARSVEAIDIRTPAGNRRIVDVRIVPLRVGDDLMGASVSYTDVTVQHALRQELERSRRELESSFEELQSTNEELEAMNEELQSTNEELATSNEELGQRTLEINEVNAFLEAILGSLGLAAVVLDRSLRVRIWNHQATELWGLRREEAEGAHFLGLDIGLPVELLKPGLRASIDGGTDRQEVVVEAVNRRGRQISCQVTVSAIGGGGDHASGAIVLMQETRLVA